MVVSESEEVAYKAEMSLVNHCSFLVFSNFLVKASKRLERGEQGKRREFLIYQCYKILRIM